MVVRGVRRCRQDSRVELACRMVRYCWCGGVEGWHWRIYPVVVLYASGDIKLPGLAQGGNGRMRLSSRAAWWGMCLRRGCCRAPMLHCPSLPQLFSEGKFHLIAAQGAPIAVCQKRWGFLQIAEQRRINQGHTVTWLKQSQISTLTKVIDFIAFDQRTSIPTSSVAPLDPFEVSSVDLWKRQEKVSWHRTYRTRFGATVGVRSQLLR